MTVQPKLPDRNELLRLAQDPKTTPFDYIVVGSGAGGGPLAARLALGGRRVLVLEAGTDPAYGPNGKPPPQAPDDTAEGMREVYAVPAFHAAATEDPDISWTFSVRHYADQARQSRDSKYRPAHDPSQQDGAGTGGIQYPRTAAIGGCTGHYAMIIIRPNDADWDWIAERTNDPSWRSENMQGYFPKIEQCLYYGTYNNFARKTLGFLADVVHGIAALVDPRRHLDLGGHGQKGWQPTSFIDPLIVASIVRGDRTFLKVLLDVALATLGAKGERMVFLRALLRLELLKFLDPNVRSPDIPSRAHLSLISIGTDGKRRFGLREHLLAVQKNFPQQLVIATGVHATRLLFKAGVANAPPQAIGVEVLEGTHLYRASQVQPSTPTPASLQYFARREVIVCGGAFNTPQLLMLSGIGDRAALGKLGIGGPRDMQGNPLSPIVHLPGVGRHMQDRYEVSVISEAKEDFSTLAGVSFVPDQAGDPARTRWLKDGSGLYSINGGALAMMMSSTGNQAVRRDPDLFIFGVPAAFRGYYWDWSKELLHKTMGATTEVRNLWSWVILKAYTSNNNGTVQLRSTDPLDTPQIDFHSFDDDAGALFQGDLDALGEAVARVREINAGVTVFDKELQPDLTARQDGSKQLADWIKDEAWGHHACGTCRIGADAWCADPALLTEPDSVLASDFRVHGVQGLRVVDASVFPRIPGYFIVTPTFMIGEKAADVLLADTPDYPRELARVEAGAVRERRSAAHVAQPQPVADEDELPADSMGLALSGGGIRSATFCLGVLQALAQRGKLRRVDIISSVSGGGYAAAFLGRLYTNLDDCVADKAGRVESILADTSSPEVWWLRRHANYIDSGARGDLQADVAIVLRNLAFVHLWIGAALFGAFGLALWVAHAYLAACGLSWHPFGLEVSLWWPLPLAVLLLGVVPTASGYWFVLKDPQEGNRVLLPLLLWLVLLGCAVFGLGRADTQPWSALGLAVLLLAWAAQEIASWGVPVPAIAGGAPPSTPASTVVRNRLSRVLGAALFGLAVSVLWVLLDTLAQAAAAAQLPWARWSTLGLAPLLPLLRGVAMRLLQGASKAATTKPATTKQAATKKEDATPIDGLGLQLALGAVAFALVLLLLFYLDTLAHLAFHKPGVGRWVVITALLAAAVVGRTFSFLNLSSLQQSYAQKLVRNFLGAANDARVHPAGTDAPVPVDVPDPGDDIDFDVYRPQRNGGPLHLVGACINDTVDSDSGRQLRDDKGLSLCVGPAGLSIGLRHHALWEPRPDGMPPHVTPVKPVLVTPDPNQFHVLARRDDKPVLVERLKLGQWTAISGAAYTTGLGRGTTLGKSLLLGLLNIRIGYWWDSGIAAGERPGRFPPSLWRRLKSLPALIFRVQATLLDEWRAWFPGASDRLWYLSDGGHFDNTGLYELIRRRLPFIVAVDAGRDEDYDFEDLALVTRLVRLDFGATLEWIDPATLPGQVPSWILAQLKPGAIGALGDLERESRSFAALARIGYDDDADKASWLLLIKPCLGPGIPVDVQNYAATHASFPQQTTLNQFFDDGQWEAYRMLGQVAGNSVF